MTNVKDKILILGFGPGWTDYPQDYDGEVWSLNIAHLMCPRIDRLFIADKISDKTAIREGFYTEQFGEDKGEKTSIDEEGYKQRITERRLPFVSCHPYPDVPTYEPYPLKEVVQRFGNAYFANCIAYMLAYALLHDNVKEIELWGVKQGMLTEYMYHKGSVEFWIGVAVGKGVDIKIVGDSQLLKTVTGDLYGYRQPIEKLLTN